MPPWHRPRADSTNWITTVRPVAVPEAARSTPGVSANSRPRHHVQGQPIRITLRQRLLAQRIDERVHEPIADQQLISRLAAGDTTALEVLYDRHAGVTFAVILRIVADRGVAEDLLQESLFRVWQHAGRYDGSAGAVRTWLLAIAHNLALNELRRRRRRPHEALPAQPVDDSRLTAIPDPAVDPADAAWQSARRARLAHALDELPAPQREVIALYATGHSQSEIATRLDQPLGTVKTRMRRGLARLREILRRDGYDLE